MQRAVELALVEPHVHRLVVFGMAHEDEVVHGHERPYARPPQSGRKLARQPMVEPYAIAPSVVHHSGGAPAVLGQPPAAAGIGKAHALRLPHLRAEVVAARIGRIEDEAVASRLRGQGVDEIAAVGSEACGIGHDALGVESDGYECRLDHQLQRYKRFAKSNGKNRNISYLCQHEE